MLFLGWDYNDGEKHGQDVILVEHIGGVMNEVASFSNEVDFIRTRPDHTALRAAFGGIESNAEHLEGLVLMTIKDLEDAGRLVSKDRTPTTNPCDHPDQSEAKPHGGRTLALLNSSWWNKWLSEKILRVKPEPSNHAWLRTL